MKFDNTEMTRLEGYQKALIVCFGIIPEIKQLKEVDRLLR